jgi:hypothetical protein
MDDMSIAYIALVIVAFAAFAFSLAANSWNTRNWK